MMTLDLVTTYSGTIKNRLEKIKKRGGTETFTDSKYTYVLLATGERPTGGYGIEVVDAKEVHLESGSYIQITAKEIRPKPGDVLIQVLTYPDRKSVV